MGWQRTLNIFNSRTEMERNMRIRVIHKNVNSIHSENNRLPQIRRERRDTNSEIQ